MLPDNPITDQKEILLKTKALQKCFIENGEERIIFDNLDIECNASQSLSIIGPSGTGKSTLLHVLGLLDSPTAGAFFLKGKDTSLWSNKKKAAFRSESIGFVFQKHHLLSELSLLENVSLPLLKTGIPKNKAENEAEVLLQSMGLSNRKDAKPTILSGGELQRGAICRATIHKPEILLMDEPTGSLDADRGKAVISDILELIKPQKTACIIVTHNLDFANQTDISFKLNNAKLQKC